MNGQRESSLYTLSVRVKQTKAQAKEDIPFKELQIWGIHTQSDPSGIPCQARDKAEF